MGTHEIGSIWSILFVIVEGPLLLGADDKLM